MEEQKTNTYRSIPAQRGLPVKTNIRSGSLSDTAESTFFWLLDTLQKPTDWAYNLVVPVEERTRL